MAVASAVNSLARKAKVLKEGEPNLAGDYIREGLGAVVSVKVRRSWLVCSLVAFAALASCNHS
jgi:DNA gyrase/topoisomerase IV subunit B